MDQGKSGIPSTKTRCLLTSQLEMRGFGKYWRRDSLQISVSVTEEGSST